MQKAGNENETLLARNALERKDACAMHQNHFGHALEQPGKSFENAELSTPSTSKPPLL